MRRVGWRHLIILGVALLACAPAFAQRADPVQDLYQRLREGGDGAKQAAFELFRRRDQDKELRRMLAEPNSKTRWKLNILEALEYGALAQGDDTRPKAGCLLAYEALDDPVSEVSELAIKTFGWIEVPSTYTFIGQQLVKLRWVSLDKSAGKRAMALVATLEQMRNPQRATEVLAGVLDGRLGPALEVRVREALKNMTSQQFSSPKAWVNWTKSMSGLTLAEWKARVKVAQQEKLRRYEQECEEMFKSLLAALRKSPDLLKELEKGLKQVTNPAVRKRAVLELGRMGRLRGGGEESQRKRAVALLKSQLPAEGETSASFDEIQTMVILHLGKTGDPTLLPDIARFLTVTSSPRMRVAAARALGELGAGAATGPLVRELTRPAVDGLETNPELVQALIQALGKIRYNAVAGRSETVSAVLAKFCRGILQSNGEAGPYADLHLTRAAEALGKLEYRGAGQIAEAVPLLIQLATHADPNVRNAAVTSLGPLAHEGAFPLLKVRLAEETENYIRSSILVSIGMQAIAAPDQAPAAIDLLLPFLLGNSQKFRQRSFDAIKGIVRSDSTFAAYAHLTMSLQKNRERKVALQAALPFLRLLPSADALGERMKANFERYRALIALRAEALLGSEPGRALEDYAIVLGDQKVEAKTLPWLVGKARAKLNLGLFKEAFALAHGNLDVIDGSTPADQRLAAWTLILDILDSTRAKQPEVADAFLRQLDKNVSSLPNALKKRFEGLKASK